MVNLRGADGQSGAEYSDVFFGIASGLLGLLGLIVLTYSVQNALILFALALLVSPIGLPMIAVGVLSVRNRSTIAH